MSEQFCTECNGRGMVFRYIGHEGRTAQFPCHSCNGTGQRPIDPEVEQRLRDEIANSGDC